MRRRGGRRLGAGPPRPFQSRLILAESARGKVLICGDAGMYCWPEKSMVDGVLTAGEDRLKIRFVRLIAIGRSCGLEALAALRRWMSS